MSPPVALRQVRFWIGVLLAAGGLISRVAPITAAAVIGVIAAAAGITLMSSRYAGQWFRTATALRTTLQIGALACALTAVIALVTSIGFELVWHAAQASLGALGLTLAIAGWQTRRDSAALNRVAEAIALDDKASLDRVVEPVLAIPRPSAFLIVPALFLARRFDLVERLGRANRVPHYERFSAHILAKALFELGKVDEAHAIAIEHADDDKQGREMREGWRQLLARIAISRGAADTVVQMPMTCPVDNPALQGAWLLVLADAYVVTGNRDRASALIDDAFEIARVAGANVDELLADVATQPRPISELAAAKRERSRSRQAAG